MFGDAAAMLVDSFAYGMNLFAEKLKHQTDNDGPDSLSWILGDAGMKGNSSVKRRLLFETVIPFISITCLIIVSLVVTGDAIRVLTVSNADYVAPIEAESESEVKFMFLFSVGGLVLDLGCALIFNARGTDAFIEKKMSVSAQKHKESIDLAFGTAWEADLDEHEFGELEIEESFGPPKTFYGSSSSSSSGSRISGSREDDSIVGRTKTCLYGCLSCICPSAVLKIENTDKYKKNFNMISAFTHVSADLIRTISVFIAAIVSRVTGISVITCDAYAALIVIMSIVAIIVPLVRDMVSNTLRIVAEKDKPTSSMEMTSMAIL